MVCQNSSCSLVRPDDRSLEGGGETREGAIIAVLQVRIPKILSVNVLNWQEIRPSTVDRHGHCPPTRPLDTPLHSPQRLGLSLRQSCVARRATRNTILTSVHLIYRHINSFNGSRRPSRSCTSLSTDLAMGPQLPSRRRLLGPHDTFHAPGCGD